MSSVILRCSACGRSYVGRRWRVVQYCRNCKAKSAEMRRRGSRGGRREEFGAVRVEECAELFEAVRRHEIGLTVVVDPLEVGALAAGVYLPHDEWVGMMRYWSFTPGTILRGNSGKLYRVKGEKNG